MPLQRPDECGSEAHRESIDGVSGLTDEELLPFGLRAFQINLLSLFGETWPLTKITETARAAALSKIIGGREYHHQYLPRLDARGDASRLELLPIDAIRALLAHGRGLVIASFHLGHMRYIPSDLAHAGIPVCVPLAHDAFRDYSAARRDNPGAALWQRFTFVDVEAVGGSVTLAKTLAKGGCVFSTIDGNTGLDGPRGDKRRATVKVLDCTARVKTGLFSVAARFGSPILVIMACTSGSKRLCLTGPVLDPGGPLVGDGEVQFVKSVADAAYLAFGTALLTHADEWCGGDLFHQWRLPPDAPVPDLAGTERRLLRSLEDGARLVFDPRRMVKLGEGANTVWSDAVRGSCYRLPVAAKDLERQLATDGIDFAWLDSLTVERRPQIWATVCHLSSQGAVAPDNRRETRADLDQRHSEIVHPSVHGMSDEHHDTVH